MSLMNMASTGDQSSSGNGEGGDDQKNTQGTDTGQNQQNGTGDQGGANDDGKQQSTDMQGRSTGDDGKDFKVARPDNIPEKFWDGDKGEARIDDILKSYGEMEKELTKSKEPKQAPESYEYKLPEALVKDYGISADTDFSDSEDYQAFTEFAKEKGYSQDEFSDFMNFYMEQELKQGRARMINEFAKLGSEREAIERVKTLQHFAGSKLSEKGQATMENLANSADAVELFEELVGLATKQRNSADTDTKQSVLTEAEIDAIMKSDDYHDKKSPKYAEARQTVKEWFEAQEKKTG